MWKFTSIMSYYRTHLEGDVLRSPIGYPFGLVDPSLSKMEINSKSSKEPIAVLGSGVVLRHALLNVLKRLVGGSHLP